MLRRLGGVVVILVASYLALDAATPPKWTQIRLSNFLFITDASETRLRSTVRRLEEFREVLVRATPHFTTTSPVPTVVFVFGDEGGLRPYHPRFEGGIKNVAGYFQASDDVNFIAMAANSGAAFQIVFHEFTHFLIDNTEGETPSWFSEGLAQLNQTLTIDNQQRTAVLGAAPPGYLQLLRRMPMMSLAQLMGVDEAWNEFHEARGREMFYAQSWALTHYLVIGNPARRGQLDEYLTRVQSGDSFDRAFATAFKSDPGTLEQELKEYVLRSDPPKLKIVLTEAVSGSPQRGEPIDDAEVKAYLGDLLSRIGREDEGRQLLRSLLDANADNARAAAAVGSTELRDGRPDVALPLLERAATLRPDDPAILTAFGTALYDQEQQRWDRFTPPDAFEPARAVLARAVALDPGMAPAHLALGYAQLARGDVDGATQSLGRAIQLAPARKNYRLSLAHALLRQRDYAGAEAEIRPLTDRGRPEVRDAARTMLEFVARERAVGSSAGQARPPARAFSATGRPALRMVREGEKGVTGRFTRVECAGTLPVFHIQTEQGALRLTAVAGGVQMITYRQDAPVVGCGPVQDAPSVVVTYRPGAPGTDNSSTPGTEVHGAAVAIEFVPDGFIRP